MQVNIQGVEHDLRRIEQIDSRLYNNKDTQHVIQELGSKYMNKQLRKLCFFNWEFIHVTRNYYKPYNFIKAE